MAMQLDRSQWILVLANLVPAFGVLFLSWDAFTVAFLYWLENVVIGVFNVLKIALASGGPQSWMAGQLQRRGISDRRARALAASAESSGATRWAGMAVMKLILIPFFCFHYGLFMLVHGVFLFALLRKNDADPFAANSIASAFSWGIVVALASLVVEHGYEFVTGFVRSGRYKTVFPMVQMFAPYGRIVVMHLAIMAGGFLLVFLQMPQMMVLILVALKIAFELGRLKLVGSMDAAQPTSDAAPGNAVGGKAAGNHAADVATDIAER